MSVSQWHIRKWILVFLWILVGSVFILLFPEWKILCFVILIVFIIVTSKIFYRCPHCKKSLDLRLPIDEAIKCYHCGKKLIY